jgi:hypothetical protein
MNRVGGGPRWRFAAVAVSLALTGSGVIASVSPGSATAGGPGTAGTPTQLSVDGRMAPLDVTGNPQFGWQPQDAAGNEIQTAYRIVVTNSLTGAQAWDSGETPSSAETYVPYAGPALADGAEYDWTVTTWNREGEQSPPARSYFDMGINDSEWSGAQWIRRPTVANDTAIDYTLARKQVTLRASAGRVSRALVYIAAPMRWQLHVNGTVVDTQDDYQTAGENYYDVADVTPEASAAQRASGAAAGQLAVGVLDAHWAVGEAHPEGPQPYTGALSADVPAGATSITVNPSTASTCTSAPDRSAAFCGASYDWYAGETLGFGTAGSSSFTTDTIAAISGNTVTLAHPLAAAQVLGDTAAATAYATQMDSLITTINSKLVERGGLYDDGITVPGGSQGVPGDCTATAGDALIGNYSQTDQTFAIVYGVAGAASYPQLGTYVASEGMKQARWTSGSSSWHWSRRGSQARW